MRAYASKIIGSDYPMVSNKKVNIKSYKDYYDLIECQLFDVVSVNWNGHEISIFLDDEGLFKHNFGRMVEGYPEPLFGDFVICGGVDDEGNTLHVPDEITLIGLDEFIGEVAYECGNRV